MARFFSRLVRYTFFFSFHSFIRISFLSSSHFSLGIRSLRHLDLRVLFASCALCICALKWRSQIVKVRPKDCSIDYACVRSFLAWMQSAYLHTTLYQCIWRSLMWNEWITRTLNDERGIKMKKKTTKINGQCNRAIREKKERKGHTIVQTTFRIPSDFVVERTTTTYSFSNFLFNIHQSVLTNTKWVRVIHSDPLEWNAEIVRIYGSLFVSFQ